MAASPFGGGPAFVPAASLCLLNYSTESSLILCFPYCFCLHELVVQHGKLCTQNVWRSSGNVGSDPRLNASTRVPIRRNVPTRPHPSRYMGGYFEKVKMGISNVSLSLTFNHSAFYKAFYKTT